MIERKKRILIHSDFAGTASGFGGTCKRLLTYLYKTNKYIVANYACGYASNSQEHLRFPWKTYPSIPIERQDIVQRANQDPAFGRMLSYGEPMIDEAIKDFKPDIVLSQNDSWGLDFNFGKPWWNKISSIVHYTADSLPLLETMLNSSPKIEHHYVWAKFAEKEYHRLADKLESSLNKETDENKRKQIKEKIDAYRRVKTIYASADSDKFYRLSDSKRLELRQKYNIDKNTFVIGSLSRNQLRKSKFSTMEAFKEFQKQCPHIKAKLTYFTSWREGWSLPKLIEEYGLDNNDILAVYKCRATGEMFIMPYQGEELKNPKTGQEKSLLTVGLDNPLPETEINNWYNLLDVHVLPITSGGLEVGDLQAKMCEVITMINDYSCGEDRFYEDTGTIKLDWLATRELGTQFIKAVVYPSSIFKGLKKVAEMSIEKRREMGRIGKKWVMDNFSIESSGKKFEELFDSLPFYDGDWSFFDAAPPNNPAAQIPPEIDDSKWISSLYNLILCREPDHEGFEYWKNVMNQAPDKNDARKNIEKYFRDVASKHNSSLPNTETPEQYLRKNGVTADSVIYVMPKSFGTA